VRSSYAGNVLELCIAILDMLHGSFF
jgi:hypothetical protein